MSDDFVYLTIHQGFALASGIEECKKNPYFKDAIAETFVEEVLKRSTEITVNTLAGGTNILQKIKKNGTKIKISRSKFEYVTRLTGIDVFDEETMNEHMSKLNEVEPIIQNNQSRSR